MQSRRACLAASLAVSWFVAGLVAKLTAGVRRRVKRRSSWGNEAAEWLLWASTMLRGRSGLFFLTPSEFQSRSSPSPDRLSISNSGSVSDRYWNAGTPTPRGGRFAAFFDARSMKACRLLDTRAHYTIPRRLDARRPE